METVGAEYAGMDGTSLRIRCGIPAEMKPLAAVLCGPRRVLVSVRPLSEEEKASGEVSFDLREPVEELLLCRGDSGIPGILCEDGKGRKKLLVFTMPDKLRKAQEEQKGDYGIAYYFAPVRTSFALPKDYDRMDLRTAASREHSKTASRYDRTPEEREIAVHPRLDQEGIFRFSLCNPEEALQRAVRGIVFRSVRCAAHAFTVRAEAPGWRASDVSGAYLKYRSKTKDLTIPLAVEKKEDGSGARLRISGTFDENAGLRGIYWDLFVLLSYEGEECPVPVSGIGFLKKVRFSLRNQQLEPVPGNILFPFATKAGKLAFMYREKTPYDTMGFRCRELFATVLAVLGYPVLSRRKIWMIYEKFSKTAQDNSFYFFKYCMEQLPEKDRRRIFYVIDKSAEDYRFVKPYDKNVIQFLSLKHLIYGITMKICVATDAKSHFYLWRSKMSMVTWLINRKPEFFLQHGVTAMKRVDPLYGKKGSSPMTYFTATSKVEQDIVVRNFGYRRENVPITGFTRWDVLEDKQTGDDRFILLMPTWRSWLEEVSDDVFTGSDYYREYTSFIGSPALRDLLERYDIRLVFYLHPKFAPYMQNFADLSGGRIECIPLGQQPLNELMMRCSMLITDYSSVCWDVLYMDKPVVYFQFDADRYLTEHGAYIDFAKDLPGDRVLTQDGLLAALEKTAADGFMIGDEYREMAEQYFAYKDNNNSRRTAAFLKGLGY